MSSIKIATISINTNDNKQTTSSNSGSTEINNNSQVSCRPLSKRVRRKTVPERSEHELKLWSFIKNCVGKDLCRISMPVNFSEPLSMLQRLTEDFEYSEILDTAALCTDDSCKQLAYVAAFTVSSYSNIGVRLGKPFNPLLGETYECDRMDDLGWRCITEQVSHHPPVAAQHCEGRGWISWQEICLSSKFRGKYIQIVPLGTSHLLFTDSGNHYTWNKVTTSVHNIVLGKLWVDNHGETEIRNHTTGDKCFLKYVPYSYFSRDAPRKVSGDILNNLQRSKWSLTGTWDTKLEACRVVKHHETPEYGRLHLGLGSPLMLWERNIHSPVATEKCYGFSELACQLNEPEDGVAPTDSRNRPDQRLMEDGKWDEANSEKCRLEENQRAFSSLWNNVDSKHGCEEVHQPTWFYKDFEQVTGNLMYRFNGEYWTCKENADWSKCPKLYRN